MTTLYIWIIKWYKHSPSFIEVHIVDIKIHKKQVYNTPIHIFGLLERVWGESRWNEMKCISGRREWMEWNEVKAEHCTLLYANIFVVLYVSVAAGSHARLYLCSFCIIRALEKTFLCMCMQFSLHVFYFEHFMMLKRVHSIGHG